MNYVIVDAFASKPFSGNPAAVVPLDAALDERTMQAIAGEFNLRRRRLRASLMMGDLN